ncbi:MAG: aminotransferase class IV, partial [bacterium]|nr:aminotransferase class IV [bacterium]
DKGNVLEGTNFNFAVIKSATSPALRASSPRQGRRGTLITPKENVLEGLTMREVIKIARQLGMRVELRNMRYKELKTADEAFITSATREVIPVRKIDKINIGNGKPGKWSKILLEKYREKAKQRKK